MPLPERHEQSIEAANAVQIHANGARPAFYASGGTNLLGSNKGAYIKPETYNPKYDTLFKTRLLNRHPNESNELYNWRLSVYSPVSKELFDKFMVLCKGAILQPNNYSIYADDRTLKYVQEEDMHDVLSDMIEFIMKNPVGYMAVIHEGEVEANEETKPEIVMIPAEDLIMYDDESAAFRYEGRVFYVNDTLQVEYNEKTNEAITYPHNIGKKPFWGVESTYTQPYQFWSDMLVRNMNDDEAMTKWYSYPKIQQVESVCPKCQGQKLLVDPDMPDGASPVNYMIECQKCDGKGTVSNNPGEYMTISEETLMKMNGNMPEYAKFITPDVGIPKFHMERWQSFYTRVEQSLYLRQATTAAQSGDAKKEDRKDQYYFLQDVSNFIFYNLHKGLYYISKYLNPTGVEIPVTIIMPKQFDLMSDNDLVNELANLQAKTDDAQTLGEINYMVNSKIFRDEPLQKKISEVLYYADTLYGVSGAALRAKYLSGIYTDTDKIIHEKGYKLLVNIAKRMTPEVFVQTDVDTLSFMLTEAVADITPPGIYNPI